MLSLSYLCFLAKKQKKNNKSYYVDPFYLLEIGWSLKRTSARAGAFFGKHYPKLSIKFVILRRSLIAIYEHVLKTKLLTASGLIKLTQHKHK